MAISSKQITAIAAAIIVVVAAIAAFMVVGGDNENSDNPGSEDYDSVTITTFTDYNGNTAEITFNEIPERVVVGCNTALNLLLYLGLGDRIVGVYYDEEPVLDECQEEYDKLVERIGKIGDPNSKHLSGNIQTDVLLSWEPDLVIGWVSWNSSGLGTEEFFNDNGCNVMSFNTMTSNNYRNLNMMKTDYDNIGNIFNVKEKTDKLYNQIIDVINNVTVKMQGKDKIYYALVDGAVNTEKGTVWVYKNTNFIASILNQMGMENAFPNGGTISLADVFEKIGTTDLDLLIFITYGSVTFEDSLKSWQNDADLSKCSAIKNGNAFDMKLSCSYGSTPELLSLMDEIYNFVSKM